MAQRVRAHRPAARRSTSPQLNSRPHDAARTVQLVGEQADYIGGDSSIATIDETARLHLSYMQPQGETDPFNDPFYFVAIDADTGEVVDAQDAGTYFSLPWSLEAYN